MIDIKNLGTTALIFAMGIVVLSIMLQVMGESKNALKTSTTDAYKNETLTAIKNGTTSTLANSNIVNSSIYVTNATNGAFLSAGNYTANPTLGTILWTFTNVSDTDTVWSGFYNYDVNVSYSVTHTVLDASYNISVKGEQGGVKIGQWLPTIGLVLGAILIITTLGLLFMKKRE